MSAWVLKGDEIISVVRASVSAGVDGGPPILARNSEASAASAMLSRRGSKAPGAPGAVVTEIGKSG
jgi:hypothetical protein